MITGDTRSFARVIATSARSSAPVVMVGPGRWGNNRREGFGDALHGRGAGRTAARDARPFLGGGRGGANGGGENNPPAANPWEAAANAENRDRWGHRPQQQWRERQGPPAADAPAGDAAQEQIPDAAAGNQDNPNPRYNNNHPHPNRQPQGDNRDIVLGACYGCGSFDHQLNNCPHVVRCIRCGREGHGSNHCPDKKPWE